jgi:CubicO group peptidase (beta-lactamase class C family)
MKGSRMIFLWIGLFLPLAGAAGNAAPAGTGKTDAQVRDLGRRWLEDNNGVGLSIGIYDGTQRRFYNFGATQVDGNRAPTKDTVYEIGSVSKTFAGQLLARAIVEGRANLNDEVTHYLEERYPNLTKDGEPIRLLHLVSMTSQLVDNIPDLTQVRMVPGEPLAATRMKVFGRYTQQEFLRQLHRVAPRSAPGGDPTHSNVASMLLGVVLEKIYGETFDTILAREIEKPLRMGSGTQPNDKLLARGYTKDNEALPSFVATMCWPANSLRYSTDDLLRYASWQLVEPDASTKVAHRPTWSTPDKRQSVAMFWIVSETPHGRRLQYSGGTYGFASAVELYPDAHLALVLLSNKAADGAQDTLRALSARIVEVLRPEALTSPTPADAPPAGR